MDPIFTKDDLANPAKLLALLGSHWTDFYPDQDGVLAEFLNASAGLAEDVERLIDENFQILSWKTCPVFRVRGWYAWKFRRSDQDAVSIPRYGEDYRYDQGNLLYDQPSPQTRIPFPAPPGMVDCRLICSSKADPAVTLSRGIDVWVDRRNGVVWLPRDPDELAVVQTDVLQNGQPVDREYVLWIRDSVWDLKLLQTQFGYVLGLSGESGAGYREALRARMASLINGNNGKRLLGVLTAMTGVEFTGSTGEVVELIEQDAQGLVIATDRKVYRFAAGARPLVAVGDSLTVDQALTDAVQLYEFNRGLLPDDLRALSLPKEFWGGFGDLVFVNDVVPLQTRTVEGRTYVYFSVGGFGKTVKDFWDLVHARGVADGLTLANLLDVRENPTEEPTAANLPTTINPLQFLIENFFRYHTFAIRIRTAALGRDRFIDPNAWRTLVPPHTFGFVILELENDDSIVLTGPPTETSPGYVESFDGLDAMVRLETVDDDLIVEAVSFTSGGVCPA